MGKTHINLTKRISVIASLVALAVALFSGSSLALAATTVSTNITTDGNLTVTGSAALNGNNTLGNAVSNTLTIRGTVSATMPDNGANTLQVLEGTNNYIGISTTNNAETVSFGNATTNPSYSFLGYGTVTISGTSTVTGNSNVTGTLTASGNATVSGTTTLNGIANIGDAGDAITLSGTTITLTANGATNDIIGNLVDNNADAFDIQESTNNYINITTANNAENVSFGNATTNPSYSFLGSGTLTASGNLTVTGTTTLNGIANIGDGGDTITLSGTTITITANSSGTTTVNLPSNVYNAFLLRKSTTPYLTVDTNTGAELITIGSSTTSSAINVVSGAGKNISVFVADATGTNANGGAITLTAGSSTGAGNPGSVTITGGRSGSADGITAGGAVSINGGAGGGSSGSGGGIIITGGAASTGNNQGGAVNLIGGSSTGSTAGGSAGVSGGGSGSSGNGGTATITGGAGGTSGGTGGTLALNGGGAFGGNGAGGAINMVGGTSNGSGTGGLVTIQGGGVIGGGTGAGGGIAIIGGVSGSGGSAQGGLVSISGGTPAGANGAGGPVSIFGGTGKGGSANGAVLIGTSTTSVIIVGLTTAGSNLSGIRLESRLVHNMPTTPPDCGGAATYTITAAGIFDAGIITCTPPGGGTVMTTPTATLINGAIPFLPGGTATVGDTFSFLIVNLSGANAITLAGGSGVTIIGNTTIPTSSSRIIHCKVAVVGADEATCYL